MCFSLPSTQLRSPNFTYHMKRILQKVRMKRFRDFTGGPVIKTSFSTAWAMNSIPGGGIKIPTCLVVHGTTKKKKRMKRLGVVAQMVKNLPAVQET